MPKPITQAINIVVEAPRKLLEHKTILDLAAEILRMPDSKAVWKQYRKAADPNSSFFVEFRPSVSGKSHAFLVYTGNRYYTLSRQVLMAMSQHDLRVLRKLMQRQHLLGDTHHEISYTDEQYLLQN